MPGQPHTPILLPDAHEGLVWSDISCGCLAGLREKRGRERGRESERVRGRERENYTEVLGMRIGRDHTDRAVARCGLVTMSLSLMGPI